jgi:hypothetical protein
MLIAKLKCFCYSIQYMSKEHPTVIWPKYMKAKLAQFDIDGESYLRFCPRNDQHFHYNIVEETLKEFGIRDYEKIDGAEHDDIPAPNGKRYEVVGMGRCMLCDNDIAIYDPVEGSGLPLNMSADYRIPINVEQLRVVEKLDGTREFHIGC